MPLFLISPSSILYVGPGGRSRCSDSPRAGWSGDRIQAGRDFPRPTCPALGLVQPSVQWLSDLFPGDKTFLALPPILAPKLKEG